MTATEKVEVDKLEVVVKDMTVVEKADDDKLEVEGAILVEKVDVDM